MKTIRPIFLFMLCSCAPFFAASVKGQTLGGVPGLVRAPTAEMLRDGTFCIGASYIPKQILPYTEYQRNAVTFFVSLAFLPFLELDLRLTRQFGLPKDAHHTVDRSPVLRIRLLREKNVRPSFVLGFHDILSTIEEGTARHFAATYLVATKRHSIQGLLITSSLGYSQPLYANRQSEIEGWFGGLRLQMREIPWLSLPVDWVNGSASFGIDYRPARWLQLKGAIVGKEAFAWNIGMQFNLFYVFKR